MSLDNKPKLSSLSPNKENLYNGQSRNGLTINLSPGPKQNFYTKWTSQIPDDEDLYGARPSQRTVVVRDKARGEDILLSKLEFDTREVLG